MIPASLEHPQRAPLINELHARPAPAVSAPCRVAHLAFKRLDRAIERDRSQDHAHMAALCARFGAPPPGPDAAYHLADFGRFRVKWEMHSEFVSYSVFADGTGGGPFKENPADFLPADWLAEGPGRIGAALHVHIDTAAPDWEAHFAPDSVAGSIAGGGAARAYGDFRLDAAGFTRFLVAASPEAPPQQLGRMLQRLIEIETYRAMSLLALPVMRRAGPRLAAAEQALVEATRAISGASDAATDRATLERLTGVAADIEALTAETAFRLGAAQAYASIVQDRIESLREERIKGLQTFQEFMTRRYAPAMRTIESAGERMAGLAERATRAGNLLRARVDVALAEQNQQLLHSMDRRADLQLRLQETVEGLSVAAIGYYSIGLAKYFLDPIGYALHVDGKILTALAALPILAGVWLFMKSIKKRIAKETH